MIDYVTLLTIMWFLSSHYITDFIIQSEEQAKEKSYDSLILLEYCIEYALVMSVMTGIYSLFINGWNDVSYWIVTSFICYLVTHFYIDFSTSRISSKYFKEKEAHMGFVILGLDQLIHYLVIFTYIHYA